MMAFTGYLKARGHMSYSALQSFFDDIMNLDVSQGYLKWSDVSRLKIGYFKVDIHCLWNGAQGIARSGIPKANFSFMQRPALLLCH